MAGGAPAQAVLSPADELADRDRDRLAAQPLARGLLDVLGLSALLALVLGVAGLVLVCAADLGDERDHLVDLEAMGVGPAALRSHLVLRAASSWSSGSPAGSCSAPCSSGS